MRPGFELIAEKDREWEVLGVLWPYRLFVIPDPVNHQYLSSFTLRFCGVSFQSLAGSGWASLPSIGGYDDRALLVVALGTGIAILANWFRVVFVICAGYLTDMQHYLVTVDHYYFGWFVFFIALIPFFVFARRLESKDDGPQRQGTRPLRSGDSGWRNNFALLAVLAVLAVAPILLAARTAATPSGVVELKLPDRIAGFSRVEQAPIGWAPRFAGPDTEASAAYDDGNDGVEIYGNVYLNQSQGRELVGHSNKLEGESGWQILNAGERRLFASDSRSETVGDMELADRVGNRRVIFYWYEVNDRRTTSALAVQLRYAVLRLFSEPVSGMVAVSTNCGADCDLARKRLEAFLAATRQQEEHLPFLQDMIVAEGRDTASVFLTGEPFFSRKRHRATVEIPLVFTGFGQSSSDVSKQLPRPGSGMRGLAV